MADRKVSVSLTIEARQFRAEAKAAVDQMQKLAKSGEVTDAALNQMQDATDKAGASLLRLAADGRLTAAELKKADAQVDELRGSLMDLGGATHLGGADAQVRLLEAEIDKAKLKMAELSAEFRRTGSSSSLAGFKDAESGLKKLEGTLTQVKRVMGSQGNGGFFSNLTTNINQGVEKGLADGFQMSITNPYVLGAIAVAAPALGVMIGGAVLTGIGLAGIGAGIAGQLHDPQVMAAAKTLGTDVSAGFKDATSSFAKPVHQALVDFDAEWKKIQPGLKSTFSELSPEVSALAAGVAGFIGKLVPGLEKAAIAAKPLVSDFSQWLPQLGKELSDLFTTMAAHADEARQGLALLTQGISLLTIAAGGTVTALSLLFKYATPLSAAEDIYGRTTKSVKGYSDQIVAAAQAAATATPQINALSTAIAETDPAKKASEFGALATQFTTLKASANTLAQSMTDAVVGALMGVDRANIAVQASVDNVTAALKKNGRELDIGTEKGRANRTAVLDSVAANIQHYDSLIQSGIGADDAAKAYDADTNALVKQMRQAGLTTSQINSLIGKYRAVPDNVNTAIATKGLTDAINNLTDLLYIINHIPRQLTITTYSKKVDLGTQSTHGDSYPSHNQYGGIRHFAAGGMFAAGSAGVVSGGGPYAMFGEPGTGAETEGFLPRGGISHMAAGGLLSTMAGWYGYRLAGAGGGTRVAGPSGGTWNLQLTGDTQSVMGSAIQTLIRTGYLTISQQHITP